MDYIPFITITIYINIFIVIDIDIDIDPYHYHYHYECFDHCYSNHLYKDNLYYSLSLLFHH